MRRAVNFITGGFSGGELMNFASQLSHSLCLKPNVTFFFDADIPTFDIFDTGGDENPLLSGILL